MSNNDNLIPQNYVILEGGVVQNNPAIPVLDLDVLRDSFITIDSVDEVKRLRDTATDLKLGSIVDECNEWLEENKHLKC